MINDMDFDSERIWKMVEKYTLRDKAQRRPDSLNLFDNLYNCYIDNYQTCPDKRFKTGVNLLQKLPPELALVSIVIKLYEDEDGYSITLGPNDQKEIFFPYEDDEIFTYIDAGEIPPVLLEVIEDTNFCHFYNGCVVCEIRNHRLPQNLSEKGNNAFESIHVLLRPSQEMIFRYVNEVCSGRPFSTEECLRVESKLLLATQGPLCLEPEIDVVCVQNRLQYNRRKYHGLSFKRYIRKQCHARRARLQMAIGSKNSLSLQLVQFLQERKGNAAPSKPLSGLTFRRKKGLIKMPCVLQELLQEVNKYSKSYQSDVQALIQQRNEAATSSATTPATPSQLPSSTLPANSDKITEVKKPQPATVQDAPITASIHQQKPNDLPKPTAMAAVKPPGPTPPPATPSLTVSLPRSLASPHLTKKPAERKKKGQQKQRPPGPPSANAPRPIGPPVSLSRPPNIPPGSLSLPGKTTITVLSTSLGGARSTATPPNLLPKLHNPISVKQSTSTTGSMPRLKPLEATVPLHKTVPTAPPLSTLIKPPPLAPRPSSPIPKQPPSLKQPIKPVVPPTTSLMPQLHKIQKPTDK